MKSKWIKYFLLIVGINIHSMGMYAYHIFGGTLTYSKVSEFTYVIRQEILMECQGVYEPNFYLKFYDVMGNPILYDVYGEPLFSIVEVLDTLIELPFLEVSGWSQGTIDTLHYEGSPCIIQDLQSCLIQYTYTDTFFLQVPEDGLIVTTEFGSISDQLANIDLLGGVGLYTIIQENDIITQNSSPIVSVSGHFMAACIGELSTFQVETIDFDGDSIAYSLYHPISVTVGDGNDLPNTIDEYVLVNYLIGYDDQNPLGENSTVDLNQENGILSILPNQLGKFLIGIRADEYRNGQHIGFTLFETIIEVANCGYFTALFEMPSECHGLEVNFNNNSANATGYLWDFGVEGTIEDTSIEEEPTFVFPELGTYNVTLIIDPDSLCSDTLVLPVTVNIPFDVEIAIGSPECIGSSWQYEFEAMGNFSSNSVFEWLFENGLPPTSNSQVMAQTQWTSEGLFEIELMVHDEFCSDTVVTNVWVEPLPDVEIVEQNIFCQGMSIDFASAVNNADTFNWNFGVENITNDTSSFSVPQYTYPDTGVYVVTVTINQGTACEVSDTSTFLIYTEAPLNSEYGWEHSDKCDPIMYARFEWLGTGANTIHWNFGDGITSEEFGVNHVYSEAGQYNVLIIAHNDLCNVSDTSYISLIIEEPIPDLSGELIIPNIFTPQGDVLNHEFRIFHPEENIVLPFGTSLFDYFDIYELEVFNRWGKSIFKGTRLNPSWDGTLNGEPLPEGTYFYSLKYQRTCFDQEVNSVIGDITIVR